MNAPRDEIGRDPLAPRGPWRFGAAAVVHVALIVAVAALAVTPEVRMATQDLVVRLIQDTPPTPAPSAPAPAPRPAARTPVTPPPVLTAAAEAPAAPSFAVAPQPPVSQAVVAPAPAAVSAARFDADYLQNPKPVYPMFSRRNGEEGKVLLRVRVAADGSPLDVEIKQSSGFQRLDAAARDAVQKWRFVPARRGSEAVESWVAVPIVFSLES